MKMIKNEPNERSPQQHLSSRMFEDTHISIQQENIHKFMNRPRIITIKKEKNQI